MKKNYTHPSNTFVYASCTRLIILFTLFFTILFYGCRKEENEKHEIIVHHGSSIQAAINRAHPNTEIYIEPGVYLEAIKVTKVGIRLIGQGNAKTGGVIIQNPGVEKDGIIVSKGSNDFSLINVTVQGFKENGVVLDGVDGFTISHVNVINNGEYGIFPVHSKHGIIENCTASGHSDTGIYIGQSSNIVMRFNTAYANVNGLEVENSYKVEVLDNISYNNVAGILVVLLPGLEIKTNSNILISQNVVTDNNHASFALPGQLVDAVPSGIGILILGSDQTVVEKNKVQGNNFVGIAVFSSLVLSQLQGIPLSAFADIEPNPDGNEIQNNILSNNGGAPPTNLPITVPAVDLLWDGNGINNCWSKNIYTSSYPDPLPKCK
jgi:parallel beta-helix repeat protein